MNIEQGKKTLATIGFSIAGSTWDEVLTGLHDEAKPQVVGSSVFALGNAEPLYVRSGNAAFLVDNVDDLHRACRQIKVILDAGKASKLITMPVQTRSTYIANIGQALECEIANSGKVNRDMGIASTEYVVKSDPDTRTQTRIGAQVIEDLLADNDELNARAVSAFKSILLF